MSNIAKECDDFLARLAERYQIGGVVLMVNMGDEQFVHVSQIGNVLCNSEMCRRFIAITDAEVLAQVMAKHFVVGDDEDEEDDE
ncbi:MAG: hypothetical protein E6R03_06980 [Hyphomicrobiaceae bacterium]|nr:MAG: hypothetical protein E6R03_06980 [Hyphomicrobiaceae bacterium]